MAPIQPSVRIYRFPPLTGNLKWIFISFFFLSRKFPESIQSTDDEEDGEMDSDDDGEVDEGEDEEEE